MTNMFRQVNKVEVQVRKPRTRSDFFQLWVWPSHGSLFLGVFTEEISAAAWPQCTVVLEAGNGSHAGSLCLNTFTLKSQRNVTFVPRTQLFYALTCHIVSMSLIHHWSIFFLLHKQTLKSFYTSDLYHLVWDMQCVPRAYWSTLRS